MATPTPTNPAPDHLTGWDELRRAADQLQLEIHLGSMELRDRWRAFVPRLRHEIAELEKLVRGLREGLEHEDP